MFNKNYFFLIIILVIFFTFQFNNLKKHTQSFKFGDESEHLTPGWMMAKYNTRLYKDFSTNHQPIPIIASYVFFKTVNYPNLFMLIERVRQFMFVISFFGALVIILKFRLIGLISVFLIETVSFWSFGYHLLAESLTLYPTILVMGTLASRLIGEKNKNSEFLERLENILFGLCIFLIGFSLLPTWPFLLISLIIYCRLIKSKSIYVTLLSILIPTLILFTFVDFSAWFKNTIVDNLKYFLPYESKNNISGSYLILLIYPFLSFIKPTVPIAKYFLFLCLSLINLIIIIFINTKNKFYFILKILLFYLLLVLLNFRVFKIDVGFYSAFHVLGQLGAFTIFVVILFKSAVKLLNNKPKYKYPILFINSLLIVAILIVNISWWGEKKNKVDEHFIQYGEIGSISSAFKLIKLENDKLLTGELEGLVNIASDLPLAGKQNAYLNWSFNSEESKNNLENLMINKPPTFVYFTEGGSYFKLLTPYLEKNYTRIQRKDGNLTYAYILNSEIKKRTKIQWQEFENQFYKIPELVI